MAEVLARGRDADVFAHGEGRVLRRYRDGRCADTEAQRLRRLVDLGYPVPRLHAHHGPDLVMDRVEGPTLAQAVLYGGLDPLDAGRVLADLHDRLHALPWPEGPLLHLDLHPFNVLLADSGPVVVDWTNATVGDPPLDVALTALLLAQCVVTPGMLAEVVGTQDDSHPGLVEALLAGFSRSTTTSYAAALPEAEQRRRADRHTSDHERRHLAAAVAMVAMAGHPRAR